MSHVFGFHNERFHRYADSERPASGVTTADLDRIWGLSQFHVRYATMPAGSVRLRNLRSVPQRYAVCPSKTKAMALVHQVALTRPGTRPFHAMSCQVGPLEKPESLGRMSRRHPGIKALLLPPPRIVAVFYI